MTNERNSTLTAKLQNMISNCTSGFRVLRDKQQLLMQHLLMCHNNYEGDTDILLLRYDLRTRFQEDVHAYLPHANICMLHIPVVLEIKEGCTPVPPRRTLSNLLCPGEVSSSLATPREVYLAEPITLHRNLYHEYLSRIPPYSMRKPADHTDLCTRSQTTTLINQALVKSGELVYSAPSRLEITIFLHNLRSIKCAWRGSPITNGMLQNSVCPVSNLESLAVIMFSTTSPKPFTLSYSPYSIKITKPSLCVDFHIPEYSISL
ncbi:uncharacterized protein BDR25DRAFT_351826 [Lindgomyces ingoldianus]|uniref:Uncharacterized protein n=1 Tax=Lindgomyces ingoldianus TaxID=673940 RepID=A0ACB6R4R3_9PLEO|nr:uncharacterized protein BDR25DRAFT_351826 [Lindgomyces ingoldianus]KAF2474268.1 hypothetical protein BDR25DRAFT_351826 [Lindgomyces ingoldianus]